MSITMQGVEELRELVDQARGTETFRALASRLGESEQWLSLKVTGKREWKVSELVRLAVALERDPVIFVNARFPELAKHDRLATLRTVLASATDDEVRRVETYALNLVAGTGVRAPADAAPRSPTSGSRRAPPGDDPPRPAGTGSRGASAAAPRPAPRRGRARRSGPGTNSKGES